MKIESANVTIMVFDLERAIEFYVEILGFTLKNKYGNHWADIEGPGISIGLHPTKKEFIKAANMQLGIKVNDFDSAIIQLKNEGVECKINNEDKIQTASFHDPDGNTIFLVS